MSSEFKRTDRIAVMIMRELSGIIQRDIKDPRLPKLITISGVTVTRDLYHAKVYFTVYDADPDVTASILNDVSKYLRSALAKTMSLRMMPQLRFIYDESIAYGKRLGRIIDDVNRDDEQASD